MLQALAHLHSSAALRVSHFQTAKCCSLNAHHQPHLHFKILCVRTAFKNTWYAAVYTPQERQFWYLLKPSPGMIIVRSAEAHPSTDIDFRPEWLDWNDPDLPTQLLCKWYTALFHRRHASSRAGWLGSVEAKRPWDRLRTTLYYSNWRWESLACLRFWVWKCANNN